MQKRSSAETSINARRVPTLFRRVQWEEGMLVLDIGAGKYNTQGDYVTSKGCTYYPSDPYNRTFAENALAGKHAKEYHAVTISNVLNVVDCEKSIQDILRLAGAMVADNGKVYITVYEGDKSLVARETKQGYQRNAPLACYMRHVTAEFEYVYVRRGVIVASKPKNQGGAL